MAEDKKQNKDEFPEFDTEKIQESLKKMMDDIVDIATSVVDEYKGLDTSELTALSGSVTQISEDSPFLNELFEGESWKKVMSMGTALNKLKELSGSNDTE